MKTDIVIATYNNAATIVRCLKSLPEQSRAIVVDNASRDSTVATVEALGVKCHHEVKNLGFAAAANRGAGLGTNPYIFFLNPDAYLPEPSLHLALAYLESHPNVAALGFKLVSDTGQPETSFGPPVSLRSLFTDRRHSQEIPSHPTPIGWVSGGALLVRRTMFEEIGGFDPQFFLYWEDIDLGRRLRERDWGVVYFPPSSVFHQRGGSLSDSRQKARLYDESADKYFRKHYSPMVWRLQRTLRRLYRLFSPAVRP